jgi:hypothetical protein
MTLSDAPAADDEYAMHVRGEQKEMRWSVSSGAADATS